MKTSSELHNNQEQKMAKTLAICVLLALATSSYASKATPECTAAGQVRCSDDCSDVVLCMGDGADGLREEVVEACDPTGSRPTHCYLPWQMCSDSFNTCEKPPLFVFECTAPGIFPDPYTCFAYYLCNDLVNPGINYDCNPITLGFNSTRGFCNMPSDSRACLENPIPACTSAGQSGATIENQHMYYICKRRNGALFPVLYQCPGGGVFNDDTMECEPERIR